MNKVITEGLQLMPPAFEEGLAVWSRQDGLPGQANYANDVNAAIVPADQDFGGCLEIVKTQTTHKIRWTGETPIIPGCYLRVSARVKAVSGNLPAVRIGAWAGSGTTTAVSGVITVGPSTALRKLGEIVEVSAIVGVGDRNGVDMVWGRVPILGHFGLDFTGANGGVVRIDDIVIEDITSVFLRDMMDWVDVRDYGAAGNGSLDDLSAFQAANRAAQGREILVPEGVYRLSNSITFDSPVRFVGTITMPDSARLILNENFSLTPYIDAFGDEETGFRRAFQALFNGAGHEDLDMDGRRVEISAPLDLAAISGRSSFETRRTIRNGQFNIRSAAAWNSSRVTASARYSRNSPKQLSNVSNIGNIEVGSLVTGNGVGREVYVRSKNVGAGTIQLSQPLHSAASSQNYQFTRFRYLIDCAGFSKLSRLCFDGIDFRLNGLCSGVLLAPDGALALFRDCFFTKPLDRGITSHGVGCQDLHIDRCHFVSNEQPLASTARSSIGFNMNANDLKLRDSQFMRMGTTGVVFGTGHLIVGNHWYQGDSVVDGARVAGLVLTNANVKTVITGNYLDNSFLEWTNEHDANPDFNNEFAFGGLSITGNIFTANDVAPWFSWIVIKPFGSGHSIQGLNVTGNTFKSINGNITRVERVDTSIADLNHGAAREIVFQANTFNGVDQRTINPVTLEFNQSGAAQSWTLDPGSYLPFGGWTRTVTGLVPDGQLRNGVGGAVYAMPAITSLVGANANRVRLDWPNATRGRVQLTVRCDRAF